MINLNDVRLVDLLPANLAADMGIAAAAAALDAELQATTAMIQQLSIFDRLDSLTDEEANDLAWQFHVDFYDQLLPIERRRELVKNSYKWHKIKGTPVVVEELIRTIFGDARLEEWFEYGGDPYMFRVISSNTAISDTLAEQFVVALNTVKNARSHLDGIIITDVSEHPLYFGFAMHVGEYLTLKQEGV